MRTRPVHLLFAFLYLLPAILGLSTCRRNPAPTPDPSTPDRQLEAPLVQGSGALGQVTIPVPDAIGTSVTWTASTLVTITSAAPSAISAGDQFAIWCSQTGTETIAPNADGFVSSAYVTATRLTWSTSPGTWSACPFFAATRSAGTSRGLSAYISGSQDSGSTSSGSSSSGQTSYTLNTVCGDGGTTGSCQIKGGSGLWYGTQLSLPAAPPTGIVVCFWNGDPTVDGGFFEPLNGAFLADSGTYDFPSVATVGTPFDAGLYQSYGIIPDTCPGAQAFPSGYSYWITVP